MRSINPRARSFRLPEAAAPRESRFSVFVPEGEVGAHFTVLTSIIFLPPKKKTNVSRPIEFAPRPGRDFRLASAASTSNPAARESIV